MLQSKRDALGSEAMPQRPVNLNFLTIRFPITAWVSILHRLSGIFLFLLIPVLLWALQTSLASEEDFLRLKTNLQSPWVKILLWVSLSALVYHLIAGIRHLLLDLHFAESKVLGRFSAQLVLGCSVVLIVLLGYWIYA